MPAEDDAVSNVMRDTTCGGGGRMRDGKVLQAEETINSLQRNRRSRSASEAVESRLYIRMSIRNKRQREKGDQQCA